MVARQSLAQSVAGGRVAARTIGLGLFVLLPASRHTDPSALRDHLNEVAAIWIAVTVLTLALGWMLQWCHLFAPRGTAPVLVLLLAIVLTVIPHTVGTRYNLPAIMGLSPSAHFFRWMGAPMARDDVPLLPMALVFGSLAVFSVSFFLRALRRQTVEVRNKLVEMGVASPA